MFALVSSCAVQMASAERATMATISAPAQPGTDVLKSAGVYSVPVGVIFFSSLCNSSRSMNTLLLTVIAGWRTDCELRWFWVPHSCGFQGCAPFAFACLWRAGFSLPQTSAVLLRKPYACPGLSRASYSSKTNVNRDLFILILRRWYSMKPSFLNLFMKKFTRERVVPTICDSISWVTFGSSSSA